MYSGLGFGKGNTILAVLAVALGCPAYVPHKHLELAYKSVIL